MKIMLAGMFRSGINCVGKWLLRQSNLNNEQLQIIYDDWIEKRGSYMFISQINHPEHINYQQFITKHNPQNIVATIEREHYNNIKQTFDTNQQLVPIIIIREFKNWLASVINMRQSTTFSVSNTDIVKYCSLFNTKYFTIKYDTWCKNKDYRRYICDTLDLEFTDCGLEDVPQNGGGSSFDGIKYDKRGSKMKTTERYKVFEHHPIYKQILTQCSNVLDLSNEFFKE